MDGDGAADVSGRFNVQERAALVLAGVDSSRCPDIIDALGAYPQLSVELRDECIWLAGVVSPVANYRANAAVKIAYPLDMDLPVRAWAWWPDGTTLGPRHTNPDGSACVYEPGDPAGCWARITDALVTFLDMLMVWIVRHCFLTEFGRWPGHQILHTAFERIEQHQPGELCGCGSSLRYEECHADADRGRTEADHRRICGGRATLILRELLTRRRVPRSAAEFAAAARVPAPELWAARLRQHHCVRTTYSICGGR